MTSLEGAIDGARVLPPLASPAPSGPARDTGATLAATRSAQTASILALLGVAAIWGSTYVVVKDAVATMPVADFLTWRFALATLAVLALRPRAILSLSPSGVGAGVVAGLTLAAAYGLQTVGLLTTPATVSGFITGMLVVITPLVAGALLRERVSPVCWVAVGMATVGLALLSLRGLSLGMGEALTLGCAVALALHIVALSRFTGSHDLMGLVIVQMVTVTVASAVFAAPGGLAVPSTFNSIRAVAVTGLAATAVAYFVQTWAQRRLSATMTGIVLTTEPVFAGVVGILLAGEHLSGRAGVGAVIVLAAMLLSAGHDLLRR
jgi:drug/metabolite transporter (DMT)-like permease